MTDANPAQFRFHTPYRVISFAELIDEINVYIAKSPQSHYSVMIGSDSRAAALSEIVTAIAVWKIGNGGRYFWAKSPEERYATLRDRIYQEAMQSILLAQELRSALRDRLGDEFFWNNQLAVHIDVGENGPTKELKEGVLGMVRGFGFEAFAKPDAVAAFVLADKHT
ncbi:MAG: hypothetical protein HYS44_02635 [Candidatus Niyogibacteria bacterium]|nr:hypothetical protein [Candidatus Niyogibacteria bacterium]